METASHVTKRTRPDLDWREKPRGMYLVRELLQSDAFRSLSKQETDLLLFIYSRRDYRSASKGKKRSPGMDYWSPQNGYGLTIPYVAIRDFFNKPNHMKKCAPVESTVTRAIKSLMQVGFLSLVELGGNGKGNMSIYRLEHNWRVWKKGDEPCFLKQGLSREKGFCKPGSSVFCPSKNADILKKGSSPA